MDVRAALGGLVDLDLDDAELDVVRGGLSMSARVRSWLDAWDIAARRRLDDLAEQGAPINPDSDLVTHGKSSRRDADKVARRQAALGLVPELADPLAAGEVSGAHVDALANGLGQLDTKDRERLAADRGGELAELAKLQSPDEYEKTVKRAVADAQSDGGIGKLERQKRANRFKTWWDQITGMLNGNFQLDPETGMQVAARLRAEVEAMFHADTPDGCPADPLAKQQYLMALAFVRLVLGNTADGEPAVKVNMVVVTDLETLQHGLHENTIHDLGHPDTILPVETLRRMACMAGIIPIVLNTEGISVDMGRTARLATPAQRIALRAMFPTCFVNGCDVAFDRCEIHHLDPWNPVGPTDLINLRPACDRHHHALHEGGWQPTVDPRTWIVTITLPDGSTRTCRPPRARSPAA